MIIIQFRDFRAALTDVTASLEDAAKPIINAIDLMKMTEHIETYRSFGEFLTDVEWVKDKYNELFRGKNDRTIICFDTFSKNIQKKWTCRIIHKFLFQATLRSRNWNFF